MTEELFDKSDGKLDELTENLKRANQRLASLEHDAWQSHLALEEDVPLDRKTRERTEGSATAAQAKHGDRCSAKRVQDGPTCSTSFGVKAEPPSLPCRDDVLVQNGATAPKLCISPLEMRTPTDASGLLPTDKTSTATRATFHQLPLRSCPTEDKKIENFNPIRLVLQHFWVDKQAASHLLAVGY